MREARSPFTHIVAGLSGQNWINARPTAARTAYMGRGFSMYVTSIGLDVHARSIAACAFNPFTGEVTYKSFGPNADEIAAWAKSFESPKCVYESGPTGWHLARELRACSVDCVVAAVSKMQKPAAEKRKKNDRRDAEFLARMLATHNIVEVLVPTEEVEAARDLSRALDDCREDLQRARQRLSKFLLRKGYVFNEVNAAGQRSSAWTRAYWKWISQIKLEGAAHKTFEYYITSVRCVESDKRELERAITALSREPRWEPVVSALCCIKGIDVITALCLAAEAGSFSRFHSAPAYTSWLGLVPSEHSSGEHEVRGGITKTGNIASRRALVEAAWHYVTCSPRAKTISSDVPLAIKRRAANCIKRLADRCDALRTSGKRPCVANVAVARELACWVWELGCRAEGTIS